MCSFFLASVLIFHLYLTRLPPSCLYSNSLPSPASLQKFNLLIVSLTPLLQCRAVINNVTKACSQKNLPNLINHPKIYQSLKDFSITQRFSIIKSLTRLPWQRCVSSQQCAASPYRKQSSLFCDWKLVKKECVKRKNKSCVEKQNTC